MKKSLNRGFTLIELLVVIAIIGILASVILASLNSARAKGADAATKSDLSNARAQAELYYDSNQQSYSGVCNALSSANPGGIKDMIIDAQTKLGGGYTYNLTLANAGGPAVVTCHDTANSGTTASGWAAQVPLKTTPGSFFCVDSTGATKGGAGQAAETTALQGGSVQCP
ncbi:MAG TPA: type II secretion system protein [Candidatus Paceibacterota bacterium]|nr:type II secretion system protein [Candidatus Paceibacterota bacterium]